MTLENENIQDDLFAVLRGLEGIVQEAIGAQAVPPCGTSNIRVIEQTDVNASRCCYPLTEPGNNPYIIRLCSTTFDLQAAAAYEFAHELCHVWLGVRLSNALAEVICECASWYFTNEIHDLNGQAFVNFVIEPHNGVNPLYDAGCRVIIPRQRAPNHSPAGRVAMIRLAKDHLVPWIRVNPSFWSLVPRIGEAMECHTWVQNQWDNDFQTDAIAAAFNGVELELVDRFLALIDQYAVFQA